MNPQLRRELAARGTFVPRGEAPVESFLIEFNEDTMTETPTPTPPEPSFDNIIEDLGETLRTELVTLLDGATLDIAQVVNEITPAIIVAGGLGRTDLTDELKAQLEALLEVQKIRGAKAVMRTILSVSNIALRGITVGTSLLRGKLVPSLLLMALVVGGCATASSVDSEVASGLLTPVAERAAAYLETQAPDPAMVTSFKDAIYALQPYVVQERIPALPGVVANINIVCDVHDFYVVDDPDITELERLTYLRSTALLRKLFQEAALPATR